MIQVGVDIMELKRMRAAPNTERIAEYVLTQEELSQMQVHPDPIQFLASRFAAKEAVIKACPDKLTYQEFAIYKDGAKPKVRFAGEQTRPYEICVSLSHSTDYVVGFACAYATDNPS